MSPTSQQPAKIVIPIGILYSVSGDYAVIGREMLNGVLLAIEEINADPSHLFTLAPVIRDPRGSLDHYYEYCHDLLYRHGVRHIIGCYTSAARKTILPLIEGANALLWHPARYEGFESSNSVIYLGAAPNQHVLPMLSWIAHQHKTEIFHAGSNYVWSWEMDRITREAMIPAGGSVLQTKMLPLGEENVEELIADIIHHRPKAILNTMVGRSAYSFYRAWHHACQQHPSLKNILKLSLTLCEPEVRLLGAEVVEGYLVSASWFQSIDSVANRNFLSRYRQRFGDEGSPSVDSQTAWLAGHLLARAIDQHGDADVDGVRNAVLLDEMDSPAGQIRLDADNNHCWLTPHLAQCCQGKLESFWQAAEPVKPDPWLAWVDLSSFSGDGGHA